MPLRLNIQTKLVGTLVLAGLVPLLVALAVFLAAVLRIRIQGLGESFQAAARQEAEQVTTVLSDQVELAYLLSRLPGTAELVRRANLADSPTTSYARQLDARWHELGVDDPPLTQILHNPVAVRWRSIQQERVRFAEVIVTDVRGRLVASTNKTSDYLQSDEAWWQDGYAGGRGSFRMSNAEWDESAIGSDGSAGALVMNLVLPIHEPPPPPAPREHDAATPAAADEEAGDVPRGPVLGVMKVALDVSWLVSQLAATPTHEAMSTRVQLVHATGIPVRARPQDGPAGALPVDLPPLIRQRSRGWATNDATDEIYGFARVRLPPGRLKLENDLDWYVLVSSSRAAALAPLYRLGWLIAAAGVAGIVLVFLAGVYIARREIIAPLRALRTGVAQLGEGNINYRLPVDGPGPRPPEGAPFRHDEIGALAHDFNRMADRLRDNVNRLERADLLKRQFIDVASHELRTPVTYLLGVSQLAERQSRGDSPLLAKIAAKTKRLARIIDNMFKLQGGTYATTLQQGPVDLAALVEGVRGELQPFLAERRQAWDVHLDPDVPVFLGDAEKLRDVLTNLLSNAIRFSPDGAKVALRAAPRRHDARHEAGVELTVSDTGPGIPAEDLPHLFEPFAAATGAAGDVTRHSSGEFGYGTRGIGLGLSVVKRFVELHGGTVHVETSSLGTKVRVWLPTPPVQPPPNDPSNDGRGATDPAAPDRQAGAPSYTI